MKRNLMIMAVIMTAFLAFNSCSSKKTGDPIATIEALSNQISDKSDNWDEEEWKKAAETLEEALNNLPSPLEMNEKITLTAALSSISINANMHERKAAKIIEVLEDIEIDSDEEVIEGTDRSGSYDLGGAVDKYPITMHLDIDGTQVKGTYYYNKRGPNAKLNLSGTFEDGEMDLNETDEKGTPTGHFKGEFDDGEYKGQFFDNKGKSMNFLVSESGASVDDVLAAFDEGELPDDFESLPDIDDEEEDDDVTFDDDEGDSSIDKFLDDYEKYMDDYVTCMKKMQNNDPTALANYAKMLARYEKMAVQADRLKEKMSIKQAQRLNRITAKMAGVMKE